jgi:hypothetical protein
MRTLTKILLTLNGVSLLFIVLWLLVGGGERGYFGGGAAAEVDGILLTFIGGALCFATRESRWRRSSPSAACSATWPRRTD